MKKQTDDDDDDDDVKRQSPDDRKTLDSGEGEFSDDVPLVPIFNF